MIDAIEDGSAPAGTSAKLGDDATLGGGSEGGSELGRGGGMSAGSCESPLGGRSAGCESRGACAAPTVVGGPALGDAVAFGVWCLRRSPTEASWFFWQSSSGKACESRKKPHLHVEGGLRGESTALLRTPAAGEAEAVTISVF